MTQDDNVNGNLCNLPIDDKLLIDLQHKDEFCKNILQQIEKGNLVDGQLYKIDDNVLKRFIVDRNYTYETTVIPKTLVP